MERDGCHVPVSHRDRVAVDLGEDSHVGAAALHPRGADEHRPQWTSLEALELEVGLEAVHLAPESVASCGEVENAEVVAVEHDQSGARGERRRARFDQRAERLGEPLPLEPERHRGRLPTRQDETVEPCQLVRSPNDWRLRSKRGQDCSVRLEVALEGDYPNPHPGPTSPAFGSTRPRRGPRSRYRTSPRPGRATPAPLARDRRSASWPRRSRWPFARGPRT